MLSLRVAAELLNVSTKFLATLLDKGVISYTKEGNNYLVDREALLVYRQQRDKERREILNSLFVEEIEEGYYE